MTHRTRLAFWLCIAHASIYPSSQHLITDGRWLLNASTQERVRLHCVNWYGAHQEPMVPGGLERASAEAITDLILQIGANCVRLPLSDQAVLLDSKVDPAFIANLGGTDITTVLGVLDYVVDALTSKGLMVILNSHTTVPGWVGMEGHMYEEAPQGLWHGPNISTHEWAKGLALLAARYARNALVVGIDLRNEIHDQDGTVITWGESSDINSDWLAASALAERQIALVNQDILIIVSGLCRAYDLRAMVSLPGPLPALYRRKLVYSTHMYVFSWWWIDLLPWETVGWVSTALFLLLFLILLACYYYDARLRSHHNKYKLLHSNHRKDSEAWMAILAAFSPFASLWIAVAYGKMAVAQVAGCSTIAHEAEPWLVLGIILFVLSFAALILSASVFSSCFKCKPVLISLLGWTCLLCLALMTLSYCTTTYWMVLTELSRWQLDKRSIPVWVGEFGTGVGDVSQGWSFLTRVLRDYDLDFAYWAINGLKWHNGAWTVEGFGLLSEDYKAIRDQAFADSLFL